MLPPPVPSEGASPRQTPTPQNPPSATVSASPNDSDSLLLPDGTPIRIKVANGFSSTTTKAGDVINFAVAFEVRADGIIVIPQRTGFVGKVVSVNRARRRVRDGQVRIVFDALTLPTGEIATIRAGRKPSHKSARAAEVAATGALLVFTEGLPLLTLLSKGDEQVVPEGTIEVVYLNGPLCISRKAAMALQPAAASRYAYVYVGEGVMTRRSDLSIPKLFCGQRRVADSVGSVQLEMSAGAYWFRTDSQEDHSVQINVLPNREYLLGRNRHGLFAKELRVGKPPAYPGGLVDEDLTKLTPEEYRLLTAEPAVKGKDSRTRHD